MHTSSDQSSMVYQLEGSKSISPTRRKIEIKRQLILTAVERDPGVTYRDLLRHTALSNGSLSWNIKVLEKQNKLRISRTSNGNTHFYPVDLDENTCILLTDIRRKRAKEIIHVLLVAKDGYRTVKEISNTIKKAPSTTWLHLNKMYLKKIVFKKSNKKTVLYGLHERDKIMNLLSNYAGHNK